MVGGSNYSTLISTTPEGVGGTVLSEEKQEVDSVAEVEAEVIEDKDGEFSSFLNNQLPSQIAKESGGKADPPAGNSPAGNSPTVEKARAAVAAAKASVDVDDDGGGKPAAKTTTPEASIVTSPITRKTRDDPNHRAKWEATFDSLVEFKRINGHCNVPYHRPPMLTFLMSWCHSQRRNYKVNRLSEERVQKLEALGFRWSAEKRGRKPVPSWEARLEQLKAYKAKHGTCEVDRETLDEKEMQLNLWCYNQKIKYHDAKLDVDKVHQLDALGFDWGLPPPPKPVKKEKLDGELTGVSNSMGSMKRTLATVGTTTMDGPPAKKARTTKTPPAKKDPPTPPPPDEDEWNEHFAKLQKYKRKHKNCDVPSNFDEDPGLARWVRHQKQLLRKQDMLRARMERLHKLGFEFPPGVTPATYPKDKVPGTPKPAGGTKKTSPMTKAQQNKSPASSAKKPSATSAKKPFVPPAILPGAPPPGAIPGQFPGVPGQFPGAPGGHFYPYPPFPYGPPMPFGMPQAAGAKPGAKSGSKPAAATSPQAAMPGANNVANQQHLQAQNAALRSQNDSLAAMHTENQKLRVENEALQTMHRSMMTSMEEEKMVRRQAVQELKTKLEKQEQIMTIQGSTIKKQGQQIKALMDQMKDVTTRQKEQQRVQEEHTRQEQARQLELQRQRDMQELQRQQEEQERQEQQRRQEQEQQAEQRRQEQQRQQELFLLRQHGLF